MSVARSDVSLARKSSLLAVGRHVGALLGKPGALRERGRLLLGLPLTLLLDRPLAVHLRVIYERRLEHEPLDAVYANDIHVLAGTVSDGEILCYATIKSSPDAPPGTTLRTRDRPLLPVENRVLVSRGRRISMD